MQVSPCAGQQAVAAGGALHDHHRDVVGPRETDQTGRTALKPFVTGRGGNMPVSDVRYQILLTVTGSHPGVQLGYCFASPCLTLAGISLAAADSKAHCGGSACVSVADTFVGVQACHLLSQDRLQWLCMY